MTDLPNNQVDPPYVGPFSLRTGQRIFGRDRELRDLTRLLVAERIVLLFSPSGAGKTSLIQAGLIPAMRERRFLVLPRIEVALPPPPDIDQATLRNLHILSVLHCLESRRRDPLAGAELAGMTLADYAQRRLRARARRDMLLIFDQFEEIITNDPFAHAAKEEFFRQVGQLLADKRIWALFAMREDYVAALTPYLTLIPSRLRASFRLALLDRNAALQAISGPAQLRQVTYSKEAADLLADNLCRVKVRRLDGQLAEDVGPVEPVQLQVVCLDLWRRLRPAPGTTIDIAQIGPVTGFDRALQNYYDDVLLRIAGGQSGSALERRIRDWIGRTLITAQGLRSQVMHEPGAPGAELEDTVISQLVKAYLVREESRRGFTWLELAHDRLVGPAQESNRAWFERFLAPLQRQADLWRATGETNDDLLLRGQALADAEAWLAAHSADLNQVEARFLARSRRFQAQIDRDQRMRDASLAQALAARAMRLLRFGGGDEQATLLARQAYLFLQRAQSPAIDQVDEALRAVLSREEYSVSVAFPDIEILSVAVSPDGRWLAAGCGDGAVRMWDLQHPGGLPRPLPGRTRIAPVRILAFDAAGRQIAAGDESGALDVWNLEPADTPPRSFEGHRRAVSGLTFDRAGRRLVSAGRDGRVVLWSIDTAAPPVDLAAPAGAINALALRPDRDEVVAGGEDRAVRLWSLPEGEGAAVLRFTWTLPDYVTTLAFVATGDWMAVGSRSRRVFLIDMASPRRSLVEFSGYTAPISGLAFSSDQTQLASSTIDGHVRFWSFPEPLGKLRLDDFELKRPREHDLRAILPAIDSLAIGPDGRRLFATGSGRLQIWEIGRPPGVPVPLPLENPASALFFTAGGSTLITSIGGGVILWSLRMQAAADVPLDDEAIVRYGLDTLRVPLARGAISACAVSGDGSLLASVAPGESEDQVVIFDLRQLRRLEVVRIARSQQPVLALGADGARFAMAGVSPTIVVVDWRSRKVELIERPPTHSGVVCLLRFEPDGRLGPVVSVAGAQIFFWNATAGNAVRQISGANGATRALVLSADGASLVAGGDDQAVRLWDLRNPDAAPVTLRGPRSSVLALALSLDDDRIAAGCADGTIWIWSRTQLDMAPVVLQGERKPIAALAFSSHRRLLASSDAGGAVRLWISETAQLADLARTRVWRNLSLDEWRLFVGAPETTPYELTSADLPPGE